jgi:ribosomal protein S18 acetylase RimI-like enzyme
MFITIEPALLSDALEIAEFSRRTFRESFADQNSFENMEKFMRQFSTDTLAAEVSHEENTFFVARLEKEIMGYIKLTLAEKPAELAGLKNIEIARIYIDKKMKGQGIGNKLMQAGLDFAKMSGFEVVWLGVWEFNSAALKFYKKWGFERFSEHIFMLGDDPQTDWLLKRYV